MAVLYFVLYRKSRAKIKINTEIPAGTKIHVFGKVDLGDFFKEVKAYFDKLAGITTLGYLWAGIGFVIAAIVALISGYVAIN